MIIHKNLRNVLRIVLEFFWNFFWKFFGVFVGGFFGRNFGRNFWRNFLGGFFGGIFLGGFFWEEYFGRNYLVEINKELMFLSRFLGNFVSMQEGRKEDKFRSLEVRRQAHRT